MVRIGVAVALGDDAALRYGDLVAPSMPVPSLPGKGLPPALDYLVVRKLGVDAELAMLEDVAVGAYRLAPMSPADVAAARRIVEQHRDLGVGLSDASVVALANKHRTLDILTLDERHFRAMRSAGGKPFRLLPADRDC